MKNEQRTWTDRFPKKTQKWPIGTWKCAQHYWSPRNCKSKPQWAISSHMLEKLLSKRQEISASEYVEKGEPLCAVGRNVNGRATMKNTIVLLQKIKIRTTLWSREHAFDHISKGNKNKILKEYMHSMFIADLFIVLKIWIQSVYQ